MISFLITAICVVVVGVAAVGWAIAYLEPDDWDKY